MTAKDDARSQKIEPELKPTALLNDRFRQTGIAGMLVTTPGVIALADGALMEVIMLVRAFDDFTLANDPYREHDFGAFTWRDTRLFWKIDCYDRSMRVASPDPADPAVTLRVLTIMLASEY